MATRGAGTGNWGTLNGNAFVPTVDLVTWMDGWPKERWANIKTTWKVRGEDEDGRTRTTSIQNKNFNNTNGCCSVPSAILASIFGWRQQQPVSDSGPIVRSNRNVFLCRIPVISLLLLLILLFNGDPFGTGPFIPRHSSRFRSDPHDKRISRLCLDNRLYNYVWAAPWNEGRLTRLLFSTACLPDEQPKNRRSRPGLNNIIVDLLVCPANQHINLGPIPSVAVELVGRLTDKLYPNGHEEGYYKGVCKGQLPFTNLILINNRGRLREILFGRQSNEL